jgi:CheY-like chemotaxis protein
MNRLAVSSPEHANELIDPNEFVQLVRRALVLLYDYPRLQMLPLAELLVGDQPPSARGVALHHLLLDAIEELKPASPDITNPAVRRYQYLYLRYVDVRSIVDVASVLCISLRQARRDHHEALHMLASRLYERYQVRYQERVRSADLLPQPVEPTLVTEVERIELSDRPRHTTCDEVVASVLETLAPLAATRAVVLRQLPTAEPGVTPVDRALVRQILINAVGYTLSVVHQSEVVIASSARPHSIEIRIQFRAAGPAREPMTTTPRLAVCRHLLSLVDGDLRLHHSADGCQVQIVLPGTTPATILVVDDNPDVRQLFRRYLAGSHYRVVEASNFDDALDAARTVQPHVLILDVMLPVRDGWELLQRLKHDAHCAHIPVIVCSVLHERDLAFALGAADVLAKPVMQQSLLMAIARQLERRPPRPHQAHAEDTASPPAR